MSTISYTCQVERELCVENIFAYRRAVSMINFILKSAHALKSRRQRVKGNQGIAITLNEPPLQDGS